MSSVSIISGAILLFVIAALLYYQSRSTEAFVSPAAAPAAKSPAAAPAPVAKATANPPSGAGPIPRASDTWKPSDPPIAGRLYNPAADDKYAIPEDLAKAPVPPPSGSVPKSVQKPTGTPGAGTTGAPREAMAQLKDLRELDSKITTWLDAVSQLDREQPGSLTTQQRQDMVQYQGRLASIREQLGTGMIVDTYKQVAAETLTLRNENAKWQKGPVSLTAIHSFGLHADPNALLTEADFTQFFALFTAGIQELQGMSNPDPLQKVRLQQLQMMRQELNDARKKGLPPIKMSAAKNYLTQMLKPDQPLPTLVSIEVPPPPHLQQPVTNQFGDIMHEIKNMEVTLTVKYDPASAELKRSLAGLMNKMKAGEVSPAMARSHMDLLKEARATPSHTAHSLGQRSHTAAGPHAAPPSNEQRDPRFRLDPVSRPTSSYNPNNLIKRATTLCEQIREAFPEDADALGCQRVTNEFQAETVLNTVCDRLRYSVPTVTPEQFNCPKRRV